jgi:uncharacterized membrane protein
LIEIIFFHRQDCHLCEDVKQELDNLQNEFPHVIRWQDIDANAKLQKELFDKIPVLQIGPYRLQAPITRDQLRITLGAASDRNRHYQNIEAEEYRKITNSGRRITGGEKLSYWISKHYLAVFNLFILFYLGLPVLAPVMMKAGMESPARLIYNSYSIVCHQLAFRSVFLFGEQPVYPRQSAGLDQYVPYDEVTENDPEDLLVARDFLGNDRLGYKIALCQRDIAIYGGILFFGLVYGLTGRRLAALPWYLWILLGLMPIGLDGFTQLLSQLGISWLNNLIPYRESTPTLRYLTGFLFGAGTAWFGYPLVESSMLATRTILERRIRYLSGDRPASD